MDPKKSKKLSCVQNIDNNEILKVTKFQTRGTIGLIARLNFSRDGPHRPPSGKIGLISEFESEMAGVIFALEFETTFWNGIG